MILLPNLSSYVPDEATVRILLLCNEAAHETDDDRFILLVDEINRLIRVLPPVAQAKTDAPRG